MYSIVLMTLLSGQGEIPALHFRRVFSVNQTGGYVISPTTYSGGFGASVGGYGPYYSTGFGYSYFGTCNGNYYGPYLKDPQYNVAPGQIPRVNPNPNKKDNLPPESKGNN
ncbi:MAG: hypothetical protein EXR99_00785 [Gemmataceae bacterium]|nr:hypothetical protein [Gemmataceae bacterium]